MPTTHEIKILPQYFDYVEKRIKNAEVRMNDRNYLTWDCLVLKEWSEGKYTGRYCVRRIQGVFPLDSIGFDGWVLLCLE